MLFSMGKEQWNDFSAISIKFLGNENLCLKDNNEWRLRFGVWGTLLCKTNT